MTVSSLTHPLLQQRVQHSKPQLDHNSGGAPVDTHLKRGVSIAAGVYKKGMNMNLTMLEQPFAEHTSIPSQILCKLQALVYNASQSLSLARATGKIVGTNHSAAQPAAVLAVKISRNLLH
mmetsp:Transcript_8515/g.9903  ORF Transcript_8515/g.9903 Transcript_8515/m.9903 type:complete len:120 (+) Transcript_8515:1513-1872(+)